MSYPPVLGFSAKERESVGDVWSFDSEYKNVLELKETDMT